MCAFDPIGRVVVGDDGINPDVLGTIVELLVNIAASAESDGNFSSSSQQENVKQIPLLIDI